MFFWKEEAWEEYVAWQNEMRNLDFRCCLIKSSLELALMVDTAELGSYTNN